MARRSLFYSVGLLLGSLLFLVLSLLGARAGAQSVTCGNGMVRAQMGGTVFCSAEGPGQYVPGPNGGRLLSSSSQSLYDLGLLDSEGEVQAVEVLAPGVYSVLVYDQSVVLPSGVTASGGAGGSCAGCVPGLGVSSGLGATLFDDPPSPIASPASLVSDSTDYVIDGLLLVAGSLSFLVVLVLAVVLSVRAVRSASSAV